MKQAHHINLVVAYKQNLWKYENVTSKKEITIIIEKHTRMLIKKHYKKKKSKVIANSKLETQNWNYI